MRNFIRIRLTVFCKEFVHTIRLLGQRKFDLWSSRWERKEAVGKCQSLTCTAVDFNKNMTMFYSILKVISILEKCLCSCWRLSSISRSMSKEMSIIGVNSRWAQQKAVARNEERRKRLRLISGAEKCVSKLQNLSRVLGSVPLSRSESQINIQFSPAQGQQLDGKSRETKTVRHQDIFT